MLGLSPSRAAVPVVNVESLRKELETFAKDALRRELAEVKESIISELRSLPLEQPLSHRSTPRSVARQMTPVDDSAYRMLNQERKSPRVLCRDGREPWTPRGGWKRRITELVRSEHFGHTISGILLLNVVILGLQTDTMARSWSLEVPPIFGAFDHLFCMVFIVELGLRIYVSGRSFFTADDYMANILDTILVIAQIVENLINVVAPDYMLALRWLRLVRLVRVTRMLHLVPDLRMLLISIMNSMRGLIWVFLLMIIVIFLFGMLFTQMVTDHKVAVGVEKMEEEEALEELFGTLDRTMLGLYQVVSDGVHWGELVEPLVRYISPWAVVIFLGYTGFVSFAMINVITSFFVETTIRVASEDFRRSMVQSLFSIFAHSDDNSDRIVTKEEFIAHLDDPEMISFLGHLDLTPEKVKELRLFDMLDADSSGGLDLDELIAGCMWLHGSAKAVSVASIAMEFRKEAQAAEVHRASVEAMLQELSKKGQRGRSISPGSSRVPSAAPKPSVVPGDAQPRAVFESPTH